jgi:hypothetical protein
MCENAGTQLILGDNDKRGAAMGLEFLRRYGGRRLQPYAEQPALESVAEDDAEEGPKTDLDFELSIDDWRPRSVPAGAIDPEVLPQRFIDGCHSGQTIAWLRDALSYPIPVRLAEVGGVCLRCNGPSLRRESVRVERIVCLIVDSFPEREVEEFASELAKLQMRLSPALPPKIGEVRQLTYDLACMEQRAYTQAQVEMRVLEELALSQDIETLSLVDGPLGRLEHQRAIGVIKQHRTNYLGMHPQCWQVFYNLEPGQRTPAFRLSSQRSPVVSWYLKLDGANGTMPNWGIVRVEISCAHFERQRCNFAYLDRLSNTLLHLRCRQNSYARAPVSMEPIVRAEESLKALLTPPATLAQRFYHLTGL